MNVPERPKSIPVRTAVFLLCLWIAFSIGFVLVNRYNNGSNWDGLADLLLLALGGPIALLSLGVAVWVAGRPVSLAFLGIVGTGVTLIVGWSIYDEHKDTKLALGRQSAHRADIEAKYGAKCAKERDSENPFAYLICLDMQERNAKTAP